MAVTGAHPLLEEIEGAIVASQPGTRLEPLLAFMHALLRRTARDRLQSLSTEELARQVIDLYAMVDERRDPIAVRVTPSPPAGTALEVNLPDAPFLVDTVRETIAAQGYGIRLLLHPVIGVERASDGSVTRILNAREATSRESVMRVELDRELGPEAAAELEGAVERALGDLQKAVADFPRMLEAVSRMIDAARGATARYGDDEIDETVAFLEWLRANHFVLLGTRDYSIYDAGDGPQFTAVRGSGLGVLREESTTDYREPIPAGDLPAIVLSRLLEGELLGIIKTPYYSTVHRRARMDDIGIKKIDAEGQVVGLIRLVGLFTSLAYMEQAAHTPLLRRKLRRIVQSEDLIEGSHDYKAAVAIFESFPRDELFQARADDLRREVMAVLGAEESRRTSLTVRLDPAAHIVSAVVAMPRDRFNAGLRRGLQDLLRTRYDGETVDYHLSLGEGELAQLFFTINVGPGGIPEVPYEQLEAEVLAACRSWDDELGDLLAMRFGEKPGRELAERYGTRLPDYYKTAGSPRLAQRDIELLERVRAGEPFAVGLQNEGPADVQEGASALTRLVLATPGPKVPLGRVLPILEGLGLAVDEEHVTRLDAPDGKPDSDAAYLHDFGVLAGGELVDVERVAGRLTDAVTAIYAGRAESDSLNRLVERAGLTWRDVHVLRAYRRYRRVVAPSFTVAYQNDVLVEHAAIARLLAELFAARFGPTGTRTQADVREELGERLDALTSLDEDRILRGYLALIEATVRTNAYLPDRAWLSFKLRSAEVPAMPAPTPLFEIFVYSPEMEGVHLRGGPVARGGIRWSDRREDYRTEILGLMKAQMVKNAVIVPDGSKGGFVLRRPPTEREALKAAVTRRYSMLIRGMLDLTDNIVGGEVVHPDGVRVYDGDDPYLVVAADKGTAALSDVANAISAEYGFWLGDAFASGGSHGYDHKALGITARGAWESVKRHFSELGLDPLTEPFTCAGIGDMSGDVFGNGLLYSRTTRLVAAFDHRHVFIDPDPDPEVSWVERKRLFDIGAGTSWADYDASLVSAGGGVWPRTAKLIPLSAEARSALGIEAEALNPNELAQAVLRAPVDLFWNGGIGTFVKASDETHTEAGDRTNDQIRVDGADVRARVVGEGGNLGFTQLGRIEYALGGGRINTDAIDNSAGVDCSDHEVNIKILLGMAVERGELDLEGRDELMASVADRVCELVLYDNYLQAQILSQEEAVAPGRLDAHEALIRELEAAGVLDRAIEFLPSGEEFGERREAGRGLTRPELAVLLAYAKRSLRGAVLASTLPDDPWLERELRGYFPQQLIDATGELYLRHRLRREIVATSVTNDVVNSLGITWVARTSSETGSEAADVARAYWIAREVTGAVARWEEVEALFGAGTVETDVQHSLMDGIDWLVESVARRYLKEAATCDLTTVIERDRPAFDELASGLYEMGSQVWREERTQRRDELAARAVPQAIAASTAWHRALSYAPDVISACRATGRPLAQGANTLFRLGERLQLDWLEAQLEAIDATSTWQSWAVSALSDELHALRRDLTERVLADAADGDVEASVERFADAHAHGIARLERLMEALRAERTPDLAAATVAVRQARAALS